MAKIMLYGHLLESGIEADRYLILKDRERAGEITELEPHPVFVIQEVGVDGAGKKINSRIYTADFRYREWVSVEGRGPGSCVVVEEVKPANAKARSRTNAGWRLRYDAARAQNPDIEFRIIYM